LIVDYVGFSFCICKVKKNISFSSVPLKRKKHVRRSPLSGNKGSWPLLISMTYDINDINYVKKMREMYGQGFQEKNVSTI